MEPWKVYARELGGMGYGHPMWYPQPDAKYGEIQLGDIGYLEDGRFQFVFNCIDGRLDEARGERLFEAFPRFLYDAFSLLGPDIAITQNVVRGVTKKSKDSKDRSTEVDAEGEPADKTSIASLRLHAPAYRTFLDCRGKIEKYMDEHCSTWLEFFPKGLTQEDIVFVYGYTKTAAWKVSAWVRPHDADGATPPVRSDVLAGIMTRMHIAPHSTSTSYITAEGPPGRRLDGDYGDEERDQSIFLDLYYQKSKKTSTRTLFPAVLRRTPSLLSPSAGSQHVTPSISTPASPPATTAKQHVDPTTARDRQGVVTAEPHGTSSVPARLSAEGFVQASSPKALNSTASSQQRTV